VTRRRKGSAPAPASKAEQIRAAILLELEQLGRPAALSELTAARSIARDARELYITAERLRATGGIERVGEGYHRGEPHRYVIPEGRS